MFGFERFNKYLIDLIKNADKPLLSITVNYKLVEAAAQHLTMNINNLKQISSFNGTINYLTENLISKLIINFKDLYILIVMTK